MMVKAVRFIVLAMGLLIASGPRIFPLAINDANAS